MATTSSTLTAGKAIGGRNGNSKGYKGRVAGLVATATLGLGFLAAGLLGHERQAVIPGANQAGATAPYVYVALGDRDDPRFAGGAAYISDQFTYREDHRTSISPVASEFSWAIADGIRPGLLGPGLGESPHSPIVPDQFTYREDHRALRPANASVTDEYRWDFPAVTYREDHRTSADAGVTSFLPGGARFQYYA